MSQEYSIKPQIPDISRREDPKVYVPKQPSTNTTKK